MDTRYTYHICMSLETEADCKRRKTTNFVYPQTRLGHRESQRELDRK